MQIGPNRVGSGFGERQDTKDSKTVLLNVKLYLGPEI